ncbi:MAG: DUF481 domain-containing protein [Candidatus Didemnitutus sp.]|nr:DUF481 domain-containing protein [Candidatus Didemnitutus sp.]
MKTTCQKILLGLTLSLVVVAPATADRLELSDGSVVFGKIVSAADGKFKVETTFAGTIEIGQDNVKSFATDEAVHVALAAGSTVLGKVESSAGGIKVVAADGQMSAATSKVAALWRMGTDSPETRAAKALAEKARRIWAYEASVAVTGRTGVSEKLNAAVSFKATLESATDKLVFALAAERADDNGVETANRQKASADYSAFSGVSGANGWYVRSEIEKDKIKQLDLRSTTAFGLARKWRKTEAQDLEARVGVNYLYESSVTGTNFESPGLDLALQHSYQFRTSRLTQALSYTPTFEDFGNYRIQHESALELPISASLWKLRIGVANDYNSTPVPGTANLDTTYFTSLILNWK